MTWQPIETAPTGQVVEMGGWDVWMRKESEWRTRIGVARVRRFWFFSALSSDARNYNMTHWRDAPEPPEGA